MFYCIAGSVFLYIILVVVAMLLVVALVIIVIIICKFRRKLQPTARFAFRSDSYDFFHVWHFLVSCPRSLWYSRGITFLAFAVSASVRPVFRPVPNVFPSFASQEYTDRISMKFARGKYYHQQIIWVHFWQNWKRNRSSRINVNQFCAL